MIICGQTTTVTPSTLPRRNMLRALILSIVFLVPMLATAADDLPLWLVNTKLSGDFRYRHEGIDKEGSSAVYRNRIRYRLGIETKVNEKVSVGARFASGTGDPRSTNQDLTDGLSPKQINLDRAYFELTPCEKWWLTAGKFGNPFVSTDLHWDTDVNFEGGAAKYSKDGDIKFAVTGGGLWLEPYRSEHGSGMFVGQVSASGKNGSKGSWQIAAGMYSYVNRDLLADIGGFGNTVLDDNTFRTDFEILDVVLSTTMPVGKSKLTVLANPVLNTATSSDNIGWMAMAKLKGKCWERGCTLSYDYRVLEPDAVFGAFTDSDAAGGRTNQRGHRIMGDIELIDGFTAGASAYFNTLSASGEGNWYQRWMVDGVVKF